MATKSATATQSHELTELEEPWVTLVWNDPVNLMSYVTFVFQSYFGFSREEATRRMLEVHSKGKTVVSSGSLEKMEVDAQAMHGYGLWATVQRSSQ